jgi:hypothetical protein
VTTVTRIRIDGRPPLTVIKGGLPGTETTTAKKAAETTAEAKRQAIACIKRQIEREAMAYVNRKATRTRLDRDRDDHQVTLITQIKRIANRGGLREINLVLKAEREGLTHAVKAGAGRYGRRFGAPGTAPYNEAVKHFTVLATLFWAKMLRPPASGLGAGPDHPAPRQEQEARP